MTGWSLAALWLYGAGVVFERWREELWRSAWGSIPVAFAASLLWPAWATLVFVAAAVGVLLGERQPRHCRACGAALWARWAWARELRWLLHAHRRPECRRGETMRHWWWEWTRFRILRRRDRKAPAMRAPTVDDPPLEAPES